MLNVVDSVGDDALEIHIEKARQIDPDAQLGGVLEKEIDPGSLGRIAAQAARQAIMQRIRQFEKDRIYDDYKDLVGDIVTGTVRRRERGDLIVDLERPRRFFHLASVSMVKTMLQVRASGSSSRSSRRTVVQTSSYLVVTLLRPSPLRRR